MACLLGIQNEIQAVWIFIDMNVADLLVLTSKNNRNQIFVAQIH
jgi:hypothetical protein